MNKIVLKIKELLNKLTAKLGDKKMHVLCSFIITFIFGLFEIVFGIFIGCLVGLANQTYDYIKYIIYQEGNGFDKEDLIYDVIGIAIATILLLII